MVACEGNVARSIGSSTGGSSMQIQLTLQDITERFWLVGEGSDRGSPRGGGKALSLMMGNPSKI